MLVAEDVGMLKWTAGLTNAKSEDRQSQAELYAFSKQIYRRGVTRQLHITTQVTLPALLGLPGHVIIMLFSRMSVTTVYKAGMRPTGEARRNEDKWQHGK